MIFEVLDAMFDKNKIACQQSPHEWTNSDTDRFVFDLYAQVVVFDFSPEGIL
jgi:hypothetical protein